MRSTCHVACHLDQPELVHVLTISLFGANISSWKQDGKERLFMSAKAVLDGTRGVSRASSSSD